VRVAAFLDSLKPPKHYAVIHAELSTSIDSPWREMDPLRAGAFRPGTADLFVTITEDVRPLLRVDIYRYQRPECIAFQDAIVWNNRVFVGYGESVYIIDPLTRISSQMFLAGLAPYFGAFYTGPNYLLIASGDCLLRLGQDGRVLWVSCDLGLDGVIVKSVENGMIQGEGEWDPPGGWRPFALHLDSGKRIQSGSAPDPAGDPS
jgi:hypothetical protein